jgi:predicted phage gp36 major capsid-like protein
MNNGLTLQKRMFKAFHNTQDRYYWKVTRKTHEELTKVQNHNGTTIAQQLRDDPCQTYMGLPVVRVDHLDDDFQLARLDLTTRDGIMDHYIYTVDRVKQQYAGRLERAMTAEKFSEIARECRDAIAAETAPIRKLLEMMPPEPMTIPSNQCQTPLK